MSTEQDPTIARQQIRLFLRDLRAKRKVTQTYVADAVDITAYKLARIESGEVAVSPSDLKILLGFYDVPEEDWEGWVNKARICNKRPKQWWNEFGSVVSTTYKSFLAYEAQAAAVHNFEPQLIPGLLQTAKYAHEVVQTLSMPKSHINKVVGLRLERQKRFDSLHKPESAHFVLDEAVLYRQVGGPTVMREQLEHLKEVATKPNIDIHIMPFRQGLYPRWFEPFVLFEFPLAILGTVLFLEHPHSEQIIRASAVNESPASYLSDFFRLQQLAPSEHTSEAIDRAIAEIS